MATMSEKTKEQKLAEQDLSDIIDTTAPKGIGQGFTTGVGNILGGAVGAAGVAVLAPTLGLAVGTKNGGIAGGVVGLLGGAVVGVVGATVIAVTGAVSGVTQMVRGVIAAPQAAIAPSQGKWWNENEGRWVLTNMTEETKSIENVPADDRDILGEIEEELDTKASFRTGKADVKDMFYYDILEVPPVADDSTIRRRYYLLAKQYHPDRNPGDAEAAEKFKDVAEAYQVLSDPQLRKRYNRDGREGLSPDKMSAADGGMPKIDPSVLFAFLFGSDKFNDYVGRLATATSASVGDSQKVSMKDARKLQKRRLIRLAIKLREKITPFVEAQAAGKSTKDIEEMWKAEVKELSAASYGYQLVLTVGKAYNLMGTMYQGSVNSGQGLPSASKWAKRQKAALDKKKDASNNKTETVKAGLDMLKLQNELALQMQNAKTEEEKQEIAKKLESASVGIMLRVLWTTTVVDITSTIYEVTHMLFFDQSVDKETRMRRSEAVKVLGDIWMNCPEPADQEKQDKDAKTLYEEAAFAAMLETVKRRDSSQAAS